MDSTASGALQPASVSRAARLTKGLVKLGILQPRFIDTYTARP